MDEIFKSYWRAPGYQVGNKGTIKGPKRTALKPAIHRNWGSYLKVVICNGKKHNLFVHRIVAEVFLNNNAPIEKGLEVNHIDKNALNNEVSNLEIISKHENLMHRSRGIKENLPF